MEADMRRIVLYCCAVALVGCSKPKEEPAMDTTAAAPETTAAPAPAALALADVAGNWNVRTMNESGDSTLLTFEMVASADTSGWSFHFPKRDPVPVRVVAVDGDSIVTEAGPYESMLRKGTKVSTRTVNRLVDGKLVGVTTAHYATSGADSVLTLRFEGTRAQ
jgi:hypothetical protein